MSNREQDHDRFLIIRYVHDTDGRILSLLVDLNSFKFNVICLYAPNTVSEDEEGDKPTRFFFRLERKRAKKDIFESLFNESGEEKCSHNDIELILVDFYKALFSKDSLNMQIQTEIIDDLDLSLSDAEQEQCEGLFTKG